MNYIVVADNGLYCFYYRDGGVCFREYKGEDWSRARELVPRARENFTVSFVGNDKPLLIWQDDEGNLKYGKFDGDSIDTKVMITGKDELGQYYAMPAEDGMNLIYSLPFSNDVHMLMSQFVGTGGAWGAVRRVDNISPMTGRLFRLIPIAGRHFLAVYQNGGFESRLGYKEIYSDEVGKYNLIYSSIHKFGDCSFLATKYDLHAACVVRGVFGSRLVYKKKDEDGLSPGIVVSEGQDLNNVTIYMVDDRLHILFTRNDRLYCVGAQGDEGQRWAFLPLEEREGFSSRHVSKATLLSKNNTKFLANELLVNKDKPWEIYALSKYVLEPYAQNHQVQVQENYKETEERHDEFFNNMEDELMELMSDTNSN